MGPEPSPENLEWLWHHGTQWWPPKQSRAPESISHEFPYIRTLLGSEALCVSGALVFKSQWCHSQSGTKETFVHVMVHPLFALDFIVKGLSIFSHMKNLFAPTMEVRNLKNVLYPLKGRDTSTQNWSPPPPRPKGLAFHSWISIRPTSCYFSNSGSDSSIWLKEISKRKIFLHSRFIMQLNNLREGKDFFKCFYLDV